MTGLIILLCVLLIAIIIVQIGRVSELAGRIRGEEEVQRDNNKLNGVLSLIFMAIFLVGSVWSAIYYKNSMLGYGPHVSASVHGVTLDYIFNVTLFFTAIVFFITQFALFYFSYKYRGKKGQKAQFISHDNKLEIIWTIIPAIVMTFLVVGGLDAWNEVMADVGEDEEHIEIEATGMQFSWMLRYPGADGLIGEKNFKLINSNNPIGMDWNDPKNHDDWVTTAAGEVLKLPVGKKVRVRITARDVLHNFDLPHFRVKMDAVPGIPTYFVFTPRMTTEEYRQNLAALDNDGNPMYPEWWLPADEDEPDGPKRWEAFMFELACAELCGIGHYSMRRVFDIVSEEEYEAWAAGLPSYYETTIQGTDDDPFKEQSQRIIRGKEFTSKINTALAAENPDDKIVPLQYVKFNTGSAVLTEDSQDELNRLMNALRDYPNIEVELRGHTDNVGNPTNNLTLSQQRADAVQTFLSNAGVAANRMTAVGYGQNVPIGDNATEEGRRTNRRTEFKIIKQ